MSYAGDVELRPLLTGMDDEHGAHGAAVVVEEPLLLQVDVVRVHLVQLRRDVVHNGARVIAMSGNAALGQVVQVVQLEDVERLQVAIQHVNAGRQSRDQDRDDSQGSRHCA